jgi:hypothetical protein
MQPDPWGTRPRVKHRPNQNYAFVYARPVFVPGPKPLPSSYTRPGTKNHLVGVGEHTLVARGRSNFARQRGRRRRVSGGEGGGGASPASSASPAGGCRSGEAAAGPLPKTPTTATATQGRSTAAAAHGRSAAARSSRPAPLVATFSPVIASSPFSFLCFLLGFRVLCLDQDVEFGS